MREKIEGRADSQQPTANSQANSQQLPPPGVILFGWEGDCELSAVRAGGGGLSAVVKGELSTVNRVGGGELSAAFQVPQARVTHHTGTGERRARYWLVEPSTSSTIR